jgi:hypothetical protein
MSPNSVRTRVFRAREREAGVGAAFAWGSRWERRPAPSSCSCSPRPRSGALRRPAGDDRANGAVRRDGGLGVRVLVLAPSEECWGPPARRGP